MKLAHINYDSIQIQKSCIELMFMTITRELH